MTHAKFTLDLMTDAAQQDWAKMDARTLNAIIHQIMQADDEDIVAIANGLSMDVSVKFESIAALIWRLAGNEGGREIADLAIQRIDSLVDSDEAERATRHLKKSTQQGDTNETPRSGGP